MVRGTSWSRVALSGSAAARTAGAGARNRLMRWLQSTERKNTKRVPEAPNFTNEVEFR